ncbi:hypothetical protein OY671_011634, partial [Metschnikowia pulcherrima]
AESAANKGFAYGTKGNTEDALKQATKVIESSYWAPLSAHAAMEPINCVAQVKDGQVEVWCSTQAPSVAKRKAATAADVDPDKVKLHVPYSGGGFGRRSEVDMVEQAVAIAKASDGQPVKSSWTREEDMQHDVYRPAASAEFRAAVDAQGRVTAWSNRVAA